MKCKKQQNNAMVSLKTLKFTLALTLVLVLSLPFITTSHSSPAGSLLSTQAAKLHAAASELDPKVITLALKAYERALKQGYDQRHILTIIDYSKPSTAKRLFTFNLNNNQLLLNTRVSHGKNSGLLKATHFSNKPHSKASSLGLFVTAQPYSGHKGYSLRLKGLEPGFNNNAYRRAIVIHGAQYATQAFEQTIGRLGRSWGCPAVPPQYARLLINTIKNNTLIFAYYPNRNWLSHSKYL